MRAAPAGGDRFAQWREPLRFAWANLGNPLQKCQRRSICPGEMIALPAQSIQIGKRGIKGGGKKVHSFEDHLEAFAREGNSFDRGR
jgi:hypothetical protein